ncbi:MAG: alkaline phosphatase D family protein [Hyphomicrobiaceae bacterium]
MRHHTAAGYGTDRSPILLPFSHWSAHVHRKASVLPLDHLTLTRRQIVQGLGVGLGVTLANLALSHRLLAGPRLIANPFTLGVASGDPAADGFVIWTRLAPKPLEPEGGMAREAVEVKWTVAADEAMRRPIRSGIAVARPQASHTVHVEVGGLEPGREYFYRFEVAGHQSTQGRARTFPVAGREGQVRFGSAGCQRYEDGLFTAWRRIAEDRLDFIVHYGDYIYEYKAISEKAKASRKRPVIRDMPGMPGKCLTLEDFRNRYAIYKLDPDLQAAHAASTFISSFDDHEVENDWAGFVSRKRDVTRADFARRREAAFRAWYEHMPLRAPQTPRGPDILAYRRLRIGQLVQLDILDTRQHRSPQPCGGGWKACPEAKAAHRTMLGAEQEKWLYSGFRESQAQWSVLAQQVPLSRLDRDPDPNTLETQMDKWDGAEAARRRLCEAAEAAKLRNLVVLAGDVHHNRALEIRRDFDDPASANIGVEFVATSISSAGNGTDRPKRTDTLLTANPHLKFFNSQRGYVRHVVDRKHWQADYMVLDKVSEAGGKLSRRASFVVEHASRTLGKA